MNNKNQSILKAETNAIKTKSIPRRQNIRKSSIVRNSLMLGMFQCKNIKQSHKVTKSSNILAILQM